MHSTVIIRFPCHYAAVGLTYNNLLRLKDVPNQTVNKVNKLIIYQKSRIKKTTDEKRFSLKL